MGLRLVACKHILELPGSNRVSDTGKIITTAVEIILCTRVSAFKIGVLLYMHISYSVIRVIVIE